MSREEEEVRNLQRNQHKTTKSSLNKRQKEFTGGRNDLNRLNQSLLVLKTEAEQMLLFKKHIQKFLQFLKTIIAHLLLFAFKYASDAPLDIDQ